MPLRKLFHDEKILLRRLLSVRSRQYQELQNLQLEDCLVEIIDEYGSLRFFEDEQEEIQLKLPVEAQFQDSDGVWVHALVFRKGNRIDELQIYKDDGSRVLSWPSPEGWQLLTVT